MPQNPILIIKAPIVNEAETPLIGDFMTFTEEALQKPYGCKRT